jgi:hypothetical protein
LRGRKAIATVSTGRPRGDEAAAVEVDLGAVLVAGALGLVLLQLGVADDLPVDDGGGDPVVEVAVTGDLDAEDLPTATVSSTSQRVQPSVAVLVLALVNCSSSQAWTAVPMVGFHGHVGERVEGSVAEQDVADPAGAGVADLGGADALLQRPRVVLDGVLDEVEELGLEEVGGGVRRSSVPSITRTPWRVRRRGTCGT